LGFSEGKLVSVEMTGSRKAAARSAGEVNSRGEIEKTRKEQAHTSWVLETRGQLTGNESNGDESGRQTINWMVDFVILLSFRVKKFGGATVPAWAPP
jgi:hypothetical protein